MTQPRNLRRKRRINTNQHEFRKRVPANHANSRERSALPFLSLPFASIRVIRGQNVVPLIFVSIRSEEKIVSAPRRNQLATRRVRPTGGHAGRVRYIYVRDPMSVAGNFFPLPA